MTHRVIGGLLERLPRIPLGIVDLDQSQSNGLADWYFDARS
jgi:hypothetical protein